MASFQGVTSIPRSISGFPDKSIPRSISAIPFTSIPGSILRFWGSVPGSISVLEYEEYSDFGFSVLSASDNAIDGVGAKQKVKSMRVNITGLNFFNIITSMN